jgi:hypothetical protein
MTAHACLIPICQKGWYRFVVIISGTKQYPLDWSQIEIWLGVHRYLRNSVFAERSTVAGVREMLYFVKAILRQSTWFLTLIRRTFHHVYFILLWYRVSNTTSIFIVATSECLITMSSATANSARIGGDFVTPRTSASRAKVLCRRSLPSEGTISDTTHAMGIPDSEEPGQKLLRWLAPSMNLLYRL